MNFNILDFQLSYVAQDSFTMTQKYFYFLQSLCKLYRVTPFSRIQVVVNVYNISGTIVATISLVVMEEGKKNKKTTRAWISGGPIKLLV